MAMLSAACPIATLAEAAMTQRIMRVVPVPHLDADWQVSRNVVEVGVREFAQQFINVVVGAR